jgi:hypothetical protein
MINASSLQAFNSNFSNVAGDQFNIAGDNATVAIHNSPPPGLLDLSHMED